MDFLKPIPMGYHSHGPAILIQVRVGPCSSHTGQGFVSREGGARPGSPAVHSKRSINTDSKRWGRPGLRDGRFLLELSQRVRRLRSGTGVSPGVGDAASHPM